MVEKTASLVISSRRLPLETGGLASYEKMLAVELTGRHRISVEFQAAENVTGPDVDSSALPGLFTVLDCSKDWKKWMHLAGRPFCHPLLQAWIGFRFEKAFHATRAADRKSRPDVIHFVGTGWDFAGFGFLRLARLQCARFTVWPAVHSGQWGDDRIDLRLYRQADAVFCQSRHEAGHLVDAGLDASKIVRCALPPMCLPGRDGRLLREQWGIGERPVVLFLGRREESKGYPVLLQAWRRVLSTHPSAVLVLSGPGGSGYAALRDGLPADSIRDLGIADEETKARALSACDVFCLPSAHESFGIVFAEAFSYGKPVVCGPAPASREWIEEGATGLHVDQDPREVAGALEALLGDPCRASFMGDAGRRYQQTNLTWENTLASHLAAFGL